MILSAQRTSPRALPISARSQAKLGLAYERKFIKTLKESPGRPPSVGIEHNPWMSYRDASGTTQFCCPDGLIIDSKFEFILVLEIKLTWTPEATVKLQELYCPVVARALGVPAKGLVICRNLLPDSPRPQSSLTFAAMSATPLYQWLGNNMPIRW